MAITKDALQVGDLFGVIKAQFYNRTGATLLKGMIGMVDFAATEAESTSIQPGGEGASIYGNLTTPTQAGIDAGYPCVVCESDSVADNELANCIVFGNCEVAVSDDDESTSGSEINADSPLAILVSKHAQSCELWITGNTPRRMGITFEDAAVSSTSPVARLINSYSHLRYGFWWAGLPGYGASDT